MRHRLGRSRILTLTYDVPELRMFPQPVSGFAGFVLSIVVIASCTRYQEKYVTSVKKDVASLSNLLKHNHHLHEYVDDHDSINKIFFYKLFA